MAHILEMIDRLRDPLALRRACAVGYFCGLFSAPLSALAAVVIAGVLR